MHITLATVQRKVLEGECSSVVLPTSTGQIEILPGHTALLTEIGQGIMRVTLTGQAPQALKIVGGFAHIANQQLAIITESAEPVVS